MQGDTFVEGFGDWSPVGPLGGRADGGDQLWLRRDSPDVPVPTGPGVTVHNVGVHDVAFVGLHFQADDPHGVRGTFGVSLLAPCTRVLIEDCAITSFLVNLRLQGQQSRSEVAAAA
jgi:hypothetical protein